MDNRLDIEKVVFLAKRNFLNLHEYFNSPNSNPILPDAEESTFDDQVVFPPKQFNELLTYLRETSEILTRKFSSSYSTNQNQYRFLRGLWAGHATRTKSTEDITDKFDSLNQVISQLKVRMRGLTEAYNKEKEAVWNEEQIKQILRDHQKHPAFEVISERLSKSSLLASELTFKINEIAEQNRKLKEKNNELEEKTFNLKQKCRKNDKNMFELTKKKAAVEKRLYDLEVGEESFLNSSKISINSQYFSYREPSINMNLTISGVKCVQQAQVNQPNLELKNILSQSTLNCSRYQRQSEEEKAQPNDLQKSLQLNLKKLEQQKENKEKNEGECKQKYRNMKKTSRRTTVSYLGKNEGLNASLDSDSIKNVKFERKGSKVLLRAKEKKELQKSIRYSQIL